MYDVMKGTDKKKSDTLNENVFISHGIKLDRNKLNLSAGVSFFYYIYKRCFLKA